MVACGVYLECCDLAGVRCAARLGIDSRVDSGVKTDEQRPGFVCSGFDGEMATAEME